MWRWKKKWQEMRVCGALKAEQEKWKKWEQKWNHESEGKVRWERLKPDWLITTIYNLFGHWNPCRLFSSKMQTTTTSALKHCIYSSLYLSPHHCKSSPFSRWQWFLQKKKKKIWLFHEHLLISFSYFIAHGFLLY